MPSLTHRAGPRNSHSLSCSSCLDRLLPIPCSDDAISGINLTDKDSLCIPKSDAQPLVAYANRRKSTVDEDRWKTEIVKKIVEIEDPLDAFLQEFVPSSKPVPPLPKRRGGYFRIPKDVTEPDMYELVRKGFDKLVESFPAEKRPTFFNNGHKSLPLPFEALRAEHLSTKPDVVATVPTIPSDTTALRWRNIAFVIEVKGADDDDPMLNITEKRNSTLVQLAKSALNLMLAQGRLFVLLVGIYGSKTRIYRFDRAGVIVSQAFQYARGEGPAILYEFLWRLVHPHNTACRVAGGDPTIRLANKKEQQKAQNWVFNLDPTYEFTNEDRQACRFITVNDKKGNCKTDFYEEMIDANMEFMGVVEYKYGEDLGAPEARETRQPIAFPLSSEAEAEVARDSTDVADGDVTSPVAEEHGPPAEEGETRRSSFNEADAEDSDAVTAYSIASDAACHVSDSLTSPLTSLSSDSDAEHYSARRDSIACGSANPSSSDSLSVLTPSLSPESIDSDASTPPLGHRTTVGVPLRQFNSTRELVIALRDAIEGHQRAYYAGIIHQDISEGNVMIVRRKNGSGGFLQDFDCAFSWRRFLRRCGWRATKESWEQYVRTNEGHLDPTLEPLNADIAAERRKMHDRKQRTGTLHFMAIEVVKGRVTHDVRHDLESFYWLLVWMVLRHARHQHCDGIHGWRQLFDHSTDATSAGSKMFWLESEDVLTVENNPPLNRLLEELRVLCLQYRSVSTLPQASMTHDQVLGIFGDALAMEGWPEGDAALEYQRPQHDKDQEGLEARDQPREYSSDIEPSSESSSLGPSPSTLHTGSVMAVPDSEDPAEYQNGHDDQHPEELIRGRNRIQQQPSSQQARFVIPAGRHGNISFETLPSSGHNGDNSSNERLPDSRRRGNASRDAASNLATSARWQAHLPARQTQDRRSTPPLPERPICSADEPATTRSAARTMPRPPPTPSTLLGRTRSQTAKLRAAVASSSQSTGRAAKRVCPAEDGEQGESQVSKRPRHNLRTSRSSNHGRWSPYASRKGRGHLRHS
ncbi:uncharacterized protein C8Q71DRAFT_850611 [Rhodofomes roseus]|uniref:Fungal-type protein kinase domain-containing protein n=1 Tax=Rhodofomes roseus TaxID=34475 RepID=A0ABQ8K4J5_9APHY|nr:uncharacterized protein C8Q71DRAFT_850611 [Rhodofomes roseus]KAH9831790.1 hypothetical protein C8Q71DRAFT_850611 [Rhodofomes roseus]